MLKSIPDEELGLDSRRRGKSSPRKIEAKQVAEPELKESHKTKQAQITK